MGETSHERCIRAWQAARCWENARGEAAIALLTCGLRVLWDRAWPTVGDVILATITRRAIRSAERRHDALAALGLRVSDRGAVTVAHAPAADANLEDAAARVLVEVLEALAAVTGGALTPALHAALRSAPVELDTLGTPTAASDHIARVDEVAR